MALHHRHHHEDPNGLHDTLAIRNQPTSADLSSVGDDDLAGEADEPPDEKRAKFLRKAPPAYERRTSLLTQALHPKESSSERFAPEGYPVSSSRTHSLASDWSTGSLASTAELTSDGGITSPERSNTPSPPHPNSLVGLTSMLSRAALYPVEGLDENPPERNRPSVAKDSSESAVEIGLGRKRCISFACGRNDLRDDENTTLQKTVEKVEEKSAPVEPSRRPCALRFVCPSRSSAPKTKETSGNDPTPKPRLASPPPRSKKPTQSPRPPRSHRGSDSTLKGESPKSSRKGPSVCQRRFSENSELGGTDVTRFHEFGIDEKEEDDWTKELTCHKSRLTVNDTLHKENVIRKACEEAEEEALEEEEALYKVAEEEEDDEEGEQDNEGDEDELDDIDDSNDSSDEVSEGGFQTDDEDGFALSDEEIEADPNERWWGAAHPSGGGLETLRPGNRRTLSQSSIDSLASGQLSPRSNRPNPFHPGQRKHRRLRVRPSISDLPDSTDFVCGTLDEDRHLEQAYRSGIEHRRASKHKPSPHDIDPSFPTSDPEMEDDGDDDGQEFAPIEVKPNTKRRRTDNPGSETALATDRRKSSNLSLSRMHSPPPPAARGRRRSPAPPRRVNHRSSPRSKHLFGQSPKRTKSPPPRRYTSPPPSRHPSAQGSPSKENAGIPFTRLAHRPELTHTTSLPRAPHNFTHRPSRLGHESDGLDDCQEQYMRGAIDIAQGLEQKRQRRREKLYHKCRKSGKDKERRPPPGKGAQRMREVGLELAAYKGKRMLSV